MSCAASSSSKPNRKISAVQPLGPGAATRRVRRRFARSAERSSAGGSWGQRRFTTERGAHGNLVYACMVLSLKGGMRNICRKHFQAVCQACISLDIA